MPATAEAELARCYLCGFEGVYGIEVVETDFPDSTGRDTTKPMCKDVEACYKRIGGKGDAN